MPGDRHYSIKSFRGQNYSRHRCRQRSSNIRRSSVISEVDNPLVSLCLLYKVLHLTKLMYEYPGIRKGSPRLRPISSKTFVYSLAAGIEQDRKASSRRRSDLIVRVGKYGSPAGNRTSLPLKPMQRGRKRTGLSESSELEF
jgi:hypothetical protein